MAELPEELAVPGEYFLSPGHPATAAGRSQDVYAGGQIVQGHHEESQPRTAGHQSCHTARYVYRLPLKPLYWNTVNVESH